MQTPTHPAAVARSGLSSDEAARRLAAEGYNELPQDAPQGLWSMVWHTLTEPMFILLVAAGALYVVLGDLREAALLLFAVAVVLTITVVQERRTERVLGALRDMTSPRALVLRDGAQMRIPGREVVRGDVVLLAEGDRVPADAVMLAGGAVECDESLLTGEAVPVRKRALAADDAAEFASPGGDDRPYLYSGSVLVRGQAVIEVRRAGRDTELGRIGTALRAVKMERTPLQREIAALVRVVASLGLLVCAIIVILLGTLREDWLGGLLAGITAAMSLIPEEFPVVLTVFLALGAWRLSRHRVLTRRVAVIETLGAATVLCVDKTGTLTENRMRVARLVTASGEACEIGAATDLPEAFHALLEFGILASAVNPFDPMEQAFKVLGERLLAGTEHLHASWTLVQEYAIAPAMLAMTHVWQATDRADYVVAAKGAPEAILDLCHADAATLAATRARVNALAADGLRVIAVARGRHAGPHWPSEQHDFTYSFLGLVGLEDPLRAEVPAAVRECRAAGIRVAMITGDYPGTARAVARAAGLAVDGALLSGDEIAALDDAALAARIARTQVFARAMPAQKLRLVQAWIADGEVVAMTGDGVNDAPALRAAHIGIAMGARGTDVAREAASLVLANDDFASIVRAVRMGRRIFDNLRKATGYILAVHMPVAAVSLAPLFGGWPLLLFPVHVVFLELVIDPACSLVFEGEEEEADLMQRPPRARGERLVDRATLVRSLLQGSAASLAVIAVYATALRHEEIEVARTLGFTTLLVANLALIVLNRSRRRSWLGNLLAPNRALRAVLAGAVLLYAATLGLPWLRDLFLFGAPALGALLGAIAVGLLAVVPLGLVARRD
ncbi:MAG TPA: cation-translocating P-type ATPase [Gammaproteobacteria bacterium]|nr:cation-translocating P-type ATPase [Gammaproteobacteria bacterium]